jgi:hypothetical protein
MVLAGQSKAQIMEGIKTFMLNPQFHGDPEPIDVFMIPVGRWSDGTADPVKY